jgi:hypothetical protein
MLWIALVPLFFLGVAVAVIPLVVGMIVQQREARPAQAPARIRRLPPGRHLGPVGAAPAEPAA